MKVCNSAKSESSSLEGTRRRTWILSNSEEPILEVGAQKGELFKGSDFEDVTLCDQDVYKAPFDFYQADAHNLPFDDSSFRSVICAEVLEHVWNPVQVLKECKRVSSDRVLITCPDEYRWSRQAKPFTSIKQRLEETNETLQEYYERETKDAVKRGGDPHQIYHRRYYTGKMLGNQLGEVFDSYYIGHLDEPPHFAFWTAFCQV